VKRSSRGGMGKADTTVNRPQRVAEAFFGQGKRRGESFVGGTTKTSNEMILTRLLRKGGGKKKSGGGVGRIREGEC